MEDLKELLDSTIDEAKFDLGKRHERRSDTIATYSRNPDEVVLHDELKTIAESEKWNDELSAQARTAKVILPDEIFGRLLEALKDLLRDYIDAKTGKIGHAFPMDSSHESSTGFEVNGLSKIKFVSPINEFAEILVRAAAILGTEKLTEMISRWKEEDCVTYRTCALLNGLFVDTKLEPLPGIRIEPLPLSTDGVFGTLPIHRGNSVESYLGRTVLSIDTTVAPAFFHPDEKRNATLQANFVRNAGIETINQALTLEANTRVEAGCEWNDYREASLYLSLNSRGSHSSVRGGVDLSQRPGFSSQTDFTSGVTTRSIPEEYISRLSETRLGELISEISGNNDKKIRVAISRWCRSKESKILADQFIDLRIALEALFLREITGEKNQGMRFRLALTGAWYLGNGFEERQTIRKKLRDVYDKASTAVHEGEVELSKDNRELLADGQRLCRSGILKLLTEGPPDDWGKLILGVDCGD